MPLCLDQGVGILVWSPLAGGFLTGKFRRGSEAESGTRWGEGWTPGHVDLDHGHEIVDLCREIALERDVAQVSLNYLLRKPGITSLIVGARTREQLADNLAVRRWELSAEEVARSTPPSANVRFVSVLAPAPVQRAPALAPPGADSPRARRAVYPTSRRQPPASRPPPPAHRAQAVARLAARSATRDETRVLERGQVLRDRLAGHRQLAGELRGRRVATLCDKIEQPAAIRRRAPRRPAQDRSHGGECARGPELDGGTPFGAGLARPSRDSMTVTRVPSTVSSSVQQTCDSVPSGSRQRKARRRPGSISWTRASRTSPSFHSKRPRPPGRSSSSTSFANHSASSSASVSACQTSSSEASTTISR